MSVLGEFCTGFGARCGTKFSLLGQNWLKWAFLGVLGEFCTGWAAGAGVMGEFCTGCAAGMGVLGEFCTGWAAGVGVLGEFYTGATAEATHDERLSVPSLSLWSPLTGRGEISHAIPLNVFQNLNSDR